MLGEYAKVPVEYTKVVVEFIRKPDIFNNAQEYIKHKNSMNTQE